MSGPLGCDRRGLHYCVALGRWANHDRVTFWPLPSVHGKIR